MLLLHSYPFPTNCIYLPNILCALLSSMLVVSPEVKSRSSCTVCFKIFGYFKYPCIEYLSFTSYSLLILNIRGPSQDESCHNAFSSLSVLQTKF